MSAAALAERIDALVAALPQPGGVRGAIVRVEVPGFEHASAAGLGRVDTGEAVTVDHRFHVASVGKMFTATLVLQAAEAGLFGPNGHRHPARRADVRAARARRRACIRSGRRSRSASC